MPSSGLLKAVYVNSFDTQVCHQVLTYDRVSDDQTLAKI